MLPTGCGLVTIAKPRNQFVTTGGERRARLRSVPPLYRRREFVGGAAGAAAATGLGLAFWRDLLGSDGSAAPVRRRDPGALRPPDPNGIRLPDGYRSRVIARGRETVAGTGYVWHDASDGAATFPTGEGGWILVSNSEVLDGGASAIRFAADGSIEDAYRILDKTIYNCSGGPTPWGTWLSCEEVGGGRVWECDPTGRRKAVARPALGLFKHEAAAVDPRGGHVYLTEDIPDGAFYRFMPRRPRDLGEGELEVALVGRDGGVRWRRVPDPAARSRETRDQVSGATRFHRAEGIWHDDGVVYLSTTGDHRIHAYDLAARRIEVIYDGLASRDAPLLRVDQMTASPAGEVFVCEDLATEEIDIGVIDRGRRTTRFLSVTGEDHVGSELTGVAFSPDGTRMYFASQRARKHGMVYEVSGPFRQRARPAR